MGTTSSLTADVRFGEAHQAEGQRDAQECFGDDGSC